MCIRPVSTSSPNFPPFFLSIPICCFPIQGQVVLFSPPQGRDVMAKSRKWGGGHECFLLAFEFQNPRLLEDEKGFIAQKMDFFGGNIMKRRGKAGTSFGPGSQQGVSWVRRALEGKFLWLQIKTLLAESGPINTGNEPGLRSMGSGRDCVSLDATFL